MQAKQVNGACSVCAKSSPSAFCCCLDLPMLLCESCIGAHYTKYRGNYHEVLPIDTLDFFEVPGYKGSLRKRQKSQDEAIGKLKANLERIEEWKREACAAADYMSEKLTAFRSAVETEMSELRRSVETHIESGIREFREKFYEPQPVFRSRLTEVLWNYQSGDIALLSCRTDFDEWRKSFDDFLFSIDVFLQTEQEGYEPQGTIKAWSDIRADTKVNVYRSLTVDMCTAESRASLSKFGEFFVARDRTPVLQRGPISLDDDVYTGQWNQQNKQHGFGKYQWSTGTVYTGQWEHGKHSGKGRYTYSDGRVHEGEWSDHQISGFGVYFWMNGNVYTGQFVNNMFEGVGCYEFGNKTGSVLHYIGEFHQDKWEGCGSEFGSKGLVYAGEYKAGKRHGKGILYENEQCFVGEFEEGAKKQFRILDSYR